MSKAHGFHKKPSKRIPAKRKYKIEKKVREHHKKMKKLAKLKDKKGPKKEVISMPRSAPFSVDWDGSTAPSAKKIEPRLDVEFKQPEEDLSSLSKRKRKAAT